ncbi:REST corepressor 1-like isoform X2 [Dysidea avara]|uniref:REST corepressor 1-like isoform X2 n=1 Tax=Dysidea avara TaxID=196820 RepID=UPI003316744C
MNTRQSLRLIAAAAAAANGGKTLHMNGNGSFEIEKEPGMRIGEEYQAAIPDQEEDNFDEQPSISRPSLLLWKPTPSISDHDLDEYLRIAESSYNYTIEQALGMLFWHEYDIKKALDDMPNFKAYQEEWTMEEKVVFERAFHMHGKNFHRLKAFLPNKSINNLVKHYYTQWKRSYLQVSLLDLRAQDRQKKESIQNSPSASDSNNGEASNSAPIDGLPPTTMKGKQLPKGIYLTTNDFIAAFDDPLNKKIKRLEMQILEFKQQIQQNKQLLDFNVEDTCSTLSQDSLEQFRPVSSPARKDVPAPNQRWSAEEIDLAIKGFQNHGRNFEAVAKLVVTKTVAQCKNFFFNYKRKYNLPKLVADYEVRNGLKQSTSSSPENVIKDDLVSEEGSSAGQIAKPLAKRPRSESLT